VVQQLLEHFADVMEAPCVVDGTHKIKALDRVGQAIETGNLQVN